MTAEEITAKELGSLLFGARRDLLDAKKLINEVENSPAWGSVWQAIQNTEQAIGYLRQSYRNADKESLAALVSRNNRLIDVLGVSGHSICEFCNGSVDENDPHPLTDGDSILCVRCAGRQEVA